MEKFRYLLTVLVCLVSFQVSAHWQWLDKDGRKVFSDRPPPPEIPEKNILERPAVTLTTNTPSVPGPAAAASNPRPGGVDRELAEKKKKLEEAEATRRKGDEEAVSKVKADNCARAKRARASFDSGRRIAQVNEKGEPEILDAAARSAEVNRLQAIIDSDCN